MFTLSNHPGDHLKYEFVRRRTYDYAMDRAQKKFDKILHELANLSSHISGLHDRLDALDAEVEALRLDKTSVRIAGRHDASLRRD